MDLFLELSRSCNMACSHCLRGNAQDQDMPEHIMILALRYFCEDHLGVGGGEPLVDKKLMTRLRHAMLQASVYPDTMWVVTNGKGLFKEDYGYSEDGVIMGPMMSLLMDFPTRELTLATSTDKFHGPKAKVRASYIREMFESSEKIKTCTHGKDTNLLGNGRYTSCGLEEDIYEINLYYVDINGYVWGSCNLSYNFMDDPVNRNTIICFGHMLDNTVAQIEERVNEFREFLHNNNISHVPVNETWDASEYASELVPILEKI